MPVAIAPMATQALAHPDAEIAMARAAASARRAAGSTVGVPGGNVVAGDCQG